MYSELVNNRFGGELVNKNFLSADGEQEFENEDLTDYEGEDSEIAIPEEDLPKFRVLVKNKKLEMKAQYGKAHMKTGTEQKCTNVKYPCPSLREPFKTCDKRVCVNVPKFQWIWGWRKKWREFKQQGGLAQLKQQARGLAPVTPLVTTTTTAPKVTPKTTLGGGGGKTGTGETTEEVVVTTSEKFLGMPKKVGVTVAIVGGLAVLVGGFLLYKRSK